MDKITLTIYKTANGFYVEHEADNLKQSYAVECEAGEWERLNPALHGIETIFSVEEAEEEKPEEPKKSGKSK